MNVVIPAKGRDPAVTWGDVPIYDGGGRPPRAQVLHDLIRGYVDRRRQARNYDDFVRRKVELGGMDWDVSRHVSNEEAQAAAAARRERLLQRTAAAMTGELAQATGTSSDLC
ncbi:antitoxin of toxin-antitoxin stability system [Tistrella mobilis]